MRVRLGLALTGLLLLAVLSTAFIVHVSWMRTASANVDAIVGSLNDGAAAAVHRELDSTFKSSESAVEIIRSIFFQGAIKTSDEAKREFVFLSVLRSQPAVSWIGLAFPDGRFFGSHVLDGGLLEMVEIGAPVETAGRKLRRDRYSLIPGDIFFEERTMDVSQYVTQGTKWYRSAKDADGVMWSTVDILPSGFEPAAVASSRLKLFGRFEGVLMASINLGRMSEFLASLGIARIGAARIVNAQGTVLATSQAAPDAGLDGAFRQSAKMPGAAATFDVADHGIFYATTTPLGFNEWRLMTAVPRQAFTAEIDRSTRRLVAVVIGLALLAAVSAAVFANLFFTRPISKIAGELRHIESFSLDEVRRIPTWLTELDNLSGALKRMATSLSAFGRFVPTEIVRTLIAQGVEPVPGGDQREITVMFADLPGFTTLTERYGAGVTPFLTQFLTLATEAIHREGGTVDKFIGDCIMGIWNAPAAADDHAMRACRTAVAIRDLMHEVPRPDGRTTGSRVRVGISTGTAFVGNIGSRQRLSYTAIGDTVNIASRLEALGKELGTEITVSASTAAAVEGRAELRDLGESSIRGREGALKVYELVAVRPR